MDPEFLPFWAAIACHMRSFLSVELDDKFVVKLPACPLIFPPNDWPRIFALVASIFDSSPKPLSRYHWRRGGTPKHIFLGGDQGFHSPHLR
jgi:hypothetical protein